MNKEYLPIGSVVLLKDATKRVMITGFYVKTDDTNDTDYIFELSDDALEILPYGAAADILKSDVSNSYGQIYQQRYETMLQRLDSRYNTGTVYIEANGMELI